MASKKYPRTPHLPYSHGGTEDDERLRTTAHFIGQEVVILEKMDGGNVSMERDALFSRSHSGTTRNPIFDRAKALWASFNWRIDPELSLFGEWLYITHNIEYGELPGFFMMFGIRLNPLEMWDSWDAVVETAKTLEVPTVPELWRGVIESEEQLQQLVEHYATQPSTCGGVREGVIVRRAGDYLDSEWPIAIAKWVRKDHIQRSPTLDRVNRLIT